MRSRYLHNVGGKHNLPAFVTVKGSSSPVMIEAVQFPPAEQVVKKTVMAVAVSQRLRLNLG